MRPEKQYICNLSFGLCSFCAAKRIISEVGKENVVLVFADTLYEDDDTYRWGAAAVKHLDCEFVRLADGRDPWQVFADEKFLGNSRVDPCSKILKRQLIDRWVQENFTPADCVLVFGIHWSESERFDSIKRRLSDWTCRAPLCERPLIGFDEMEAMAASAGLWTQRLYALGFPHANCGGRCVKQGQAGWALLYRTMPERFLECRDKEEAMRATLGDVAMLRDRSNGKSIPLPLVELQRRIDAKEEMPLFDFGGCDCFSGATHTKGRET